MSLLAPVAWSLGLWIGSSALVAAPPELPGGWHSDFNEAVDEARAEGKGNLLLFTGLEWEEWSGRLHAEILSTPEFHESVAADFVLTHIDLPQEPRPEGDLSAEEAAHYELARRFKLRVFPSMFLCTTEGRPYGLVGFQEEGLKATIAAVGAARAAYAGAMEYIGGLEGPERAVAIDAWLQTIPEPLRMLHDDKVDEILQADPDNATGLWARYQLARALPEARRLRYAGKVDEAAARYRHILDDLKPTGESLQTIWYELADVYFQQKDYGRLLDALDRAIAAAPESARMSVLHEMMDVFTRQWIYTKYQPERMKEIHYDHKRMEIPPQDLGRVLKLIEEAGKEAPGSVRNRVLKKMSDELKGLPPVPSS